MSVDQVRRLRGVTRKDTVALRNHDSLWVRWPVRIWQASGYETWARTLSRHHVHFLLVFSPFAITAGVLHWKPATVFVLNALAIIPFAALLNFTTDDLSLHLGPFRGMVNGMFGRPVDLIVSFSTLGRLTISDLTFVI
jgi:glycopeptide antibiotics resistance protein